MEFLICEKHKKIEKLAHKVTGLTHVCLNRYCNLSYIPFCTICKNDHRDHSNKLLPLQDISFLVERLLKSPFKQVAGFITQSVSIMKKVKLIQQNKAKIDELHRQIKKQAMQFIDFTQSLIHQYAVCKKTITEFSQIMNSIQDPQTYKQFYQTSKHYLSNLDYNFQKDKLQFNNFSIREKLQKRRKSYDFTKRKVQEIRDYSMKIIEVILHNDSDDDEEEEDIITKKKQYEILKDQLSLQTKLNYHEIQSNEHEQEEIQKFEELNSKYTGTSSMNKKNQNHVLTIQKYCQADSQWIKQLQDASKQANSKIQKLKVVQAKSQNQLKNKITSLVKEKDIINKEKKSWEQKYHQKNRKVLQAQLQLRQNLKMQEQKLNKKDQIFQKLLNMAHWNEIIQGDRID